MEQSVNKRLEVFIKSSNISKVDFALSIGRVKQDIDRWVNGGIKIPVPSLTDILKTYPDLNARWLLTGEGEMLTSSIEKEVNQYKENEKMHMAEEMQITRFSCSDCIEKERIIQAQKKTIEIQDKYIASLEVGSIKNDKTHCG